ncbi:MAG: hypothetical protein ABIL11_01980 [Chloroflexota bacterium]
MVAEGATIIRDFSIVHFRNGTLMNASLHSAQAQKNADFLFFYQRNQRFSLASRKDIP